MNPALRKLNLTAHVATSVGWFGAVASFLALSVAGLVSKDPTIVRAAYGSMNLLGLLVILPLGLLALLTGVVQSLGTQWGLFKHYWVLTKLVLSVGSTLLLILHQFTAVASAAKRIDTTSPNDFPAAGPLGTQLVFDSALALIVLLAAIVLSIYKPWGKISFRSRSDASPSAAALPAGLKMLLVAAGIFVALIATLHLLGLAPHPH